MDCQVFPTRLISVKKMFECQVRLLLPLERVPVTRRRTMSGLRLITVYDYDPGLQVGEEVWINYKKLTMRNWEDELPYFVAVVKERRKEIITGCKKHEKGIFRLQIIVEAVEERSIKNVVKFMEEFIPGVFEV